MKWIGVAWTVLLNLIAMVVVLAISDHYAYDSDHAIIAAALVIIYINVNAAYTGQSRAAAAFAMQSQTQNAAILRRLGDADLAEQLENEVSEAQDVFKKTSVKFWVNMVGSVVLWIIAVLILLNNL